MKKLDATALSMFASLDGGQRQASALPALWLNIADLPLIEPRALPPLPAGIEARLLELPPPYAAIILWWPAAQVHVRVPLAELDSLPQAVGQLLEFVSARMEAGHA